MTDDGRQNIRISDGKIETLLTDIAALWLFPSELAPAPSLASRRADLAQVVSLTTLDPGVDSSRTPERRFPEPGPGFPE